MRVLLATRPLLRKTRGTPLIALLPGDDPKRVASLDSGLSWANAAKLWYGVKRWTLTYSFSATSGSSSASFSGTFTTDETTDYTAATPATKSDLVGPNNQAYHAAFSDMQGTFPDDWYFSLDIQFLQIAGSTFGGGAGTFPYGWVRDASTWSDDIVAPIYLSMTIEYLDVFTAGIRYVADYTAPPDLSATLPLSAGSVPMARREHGTITEDGTTSLALTVDEAW